MSDTMTADAAAPATPAKITRAPRTDLEADIKSVCDEFVLGNVTLGDGKLLTPHAIAQIVMAKRNDGTKVSGGAVAAALSRWAEVGFVTLNPKPVAFVDYTDAGRTEGLTALKRAHAERRSAARAAEREAAKATAATPASTDAPF